MKSERVRLKVDLLERFAKVDKDLDKACRKVLDENDELVELLEKRDAEIKECSGQNVELKKRLHSYSDLLGQNQLLLGQIEEWKKQKPKIGTEPGQKVVKCQFDLIAIETVVKSAVLDGLEEYSRKRG